MAAKYLYDSALFKSSLKYATYLQPCKIFILSAKYGLITLDEIIEPYNITLSNIPKNRQAKNLIVLTKEQKKIWGVRVIEKLKEEADIFNDEFIILAGREYLNPIEKYLVKSNLRTPLEGKKIGERIKFMNKFI